MFFQLLRRRTKRKSLSLHTITVVESARIGFSVGPLLAQVTGRTYFDMRPESQKRPPRVSNKVVSVFKDPGGLPKVWGLLVDVEEIIEGETQVSLQSVLRLIMLRLRDMADPWN